MLSRRLFIRNTSLITACVMIKPGLFTEYNKKYIGLQLYTVRDAMQKDPSGTFAKVAQIGYNSVEGATYTGTRQFYGMDAKVFSTLLKENNLIMPSSHYRLGEEKEKGEEVQGTLLHGWDQAVDDAATVGVKYMVCAYLSASERGDLNHFKYVANQLNIAGERCKKAGIQLCYHNHDFEFLQEDGQLPYDVLLNETDENLVKMEMDIYWVTKAGQDPIALIKKFPGRYPLWHLKDMNPTDKSFAEVGYGSIDFKEIFKYANKAGLAYFFVEQDTTPELPMDSITKSITYIKKSLI